MKLFEILEEFKSGQKIRRISWTPELYIEYREGLSRLFIKEPEGLRLIDADMRYSTFDIMANDWVITVN